MSLQLEREDRQYATEKQLRREHTGQCCGKFDDVDVQFAASDDWRGWVVYCLPCGAIIAEIDE